MKFDELKRTSAETADFISGETARTAEDISDRVAGSVAEADTAEYMAGLLSAAGADVRTETFPVAPAAAFGWIGVTVVCMLLAFAAYFFVSMVSVALIIVAFVPFIVQGVLCSRAFDGAYVKGTSQNVTAVLPCEGEVKKRVFFTAHTDAAKIFRPQIKDRGRLLAAAAIISLLGAAYLLAADIARWAYLGSVGTGLARGEWLAVGLVGIVFVPFWGLCLFAIDPKTVSPGANDNLSGCFVAVALIKALAEKGIKLRSTEVGVILTGAEECGLRGAKAWCDAHAEEYKGTETYFFTLDTLRDAEHLKVQNRDLNGLQKLDKDAVSLFSIAAKKAGAECAKGGAGFGATDAAAFAAAGLKAASVTAMKPFAEYYHSERDSADNTDAALLEKCFLAAVQVVEELDGAE